jgi:hypothetical protein
LGKSQESEFNSLKNKSKRELSLNIQKVEGYLNTEFEELFGVNSDSYKDFVRFCPTFYVVCIVDRLIFPNRYCRAQF